jgi:predicted aspartyl protease
MTRQETPFSLIDGDLIVVDAVVTGRRGSGLAHLVVDTGAAITTLTPAFVDAVGYGPRDGFVRTSVRTAISNETGYALRVANFGVLGFRTQRFVVHVFELGFNDIDGLLGMNFLSRLNIDIRCTERRILAERAAR